METRTHAHDVTCFFDDENRLIEIDRGSGNRSVFVYDGLGKRVEALEYTSGALTKTTRYLYDGLLPVAHLDETNQVTLHVTRGLDLSGTMSGAGGICGILSSRDPASGAYTST